MLQGLGRLSFLGKPEALDRGRAPCYNIRHFLSIFSLCLTTAMTRATIYIKRRCRQTVRPLLSTNDNRSLSQGGAVIVFYCAGRSPPRSAKLPIRLSTPWAHPLLGVRLYRHLRPESRPRGRLVSDRRAVARRAVCDNAGYIVHDSTKFVK